ncbi:hypothetical protein [Nocardioides coralli]|uniref:hypothetical protein n=1 Tax=Nocardioides coralli TaxID=2872154 RepID=UPI001CA451E6|nr:hypothetical protein [Nocardioides coralli]QZY29887.1 hypothetical protein K6T13_04135 [Nocardioides coralli]
MIQPDEFDAFYKRARTRLLLQTYALTGDLPAARSAVRDAFVVTWHHWRKVSRLPDPEGWVRPLAWSHAHRRHTARIWHRDKHLDAEAKATLAALGKLSYSQRKALLLDQLTDLPASERARELGATRADADRQLQAATEKFLAQREVGADQVTALFDQLHVLVLDTPWPRSSIIRRSGASRRRWHTLVGAAVALAALVASGTAVSVTPAADSPDAPATPSGVQRPIATTVFDADRLLSAEAVSVVVDGNGWREGRTSDNADGDGKVTPCQQARYADPDGLAALVRRFADPAEGRGSRSSVVQVAELSEDKEAAEKSWERLVGWYAGCTAPRVQLLGSYDVPDVGHQAMLLHLQDWKRDATYLVGVGRSGEVTTTTFLHTGTARRPDLRAGARLLGEAVEHLCGASEGARCTPTDARPRTIPPPKVGEVPGMLMEVDLPPVRTVAEPWVGTEARQARENAAATRCDQTDFSQRPMTNAMTRTFLIPNSKLPAAFGLTETVGTLPVRRARGFIARVRDRMRTCTDRDPGSEVVPLTSASGPERDLSIWRVTSEVSDAQTVTYWMGVIRTGTAVGQVGFVPSNQATLDPAAFDALVRRAWARLEYLPRPGR